ncbi:MAG: hypothetical protein CMH31_04870 [Micavibrio sp.]|nr:hypothetical protein [Micavibrio sp.]|tara:strand:- start:2044 stop:2349 length:306 start_codon:yes stop_codon:yes gene_type:complete
MFNWLFKNAAQEEQPEFIMWRDGAQTSRGPNPLYKPQSSIDFSVPANHGSRLGRITRTLTLSAALSAAAIVVVNEITKDENGNGYFRLKIDAFTSSFTPTR